MPPTIFACVTSRNYTYFWCIHGRTKGTKKYVFNYIWISGKRGSQLVCCTIFLLQLSLNVFVI